MTTGTHQYAFIGARALAVKALVAAFFTKKNLSNSVQNELQHQQKKKRNLAPKRKLGPKLAQEVAWQS